MNPFPSTQFQFLPHQVCIDYSTFPNSNSTFFHCLRPVNFVATSADSLNIASLSVSSSSGSLFTLSNPSANVTMSEINFSYAFNSSIISGNSISNANFNTISLNNSENITLINNVTLTNGLVVKNLSAANSALDQFITTSPVSTIELRNFYLSKWAFLFFLQMSLSLTPFFSFLFFQRTDKCFCFHRRTSRKCFPFCFSLQLHHQRFAVC